MQANSFMSENDQPLEENVRTILSQTLDFLPEEIEALFELQKTNRQIIKFYLNEYGLHLNPYQQTEIAELSYQCDILALKTAHLEFQAKSFENQVIKAVLTNKRFSVATTEGTAFKKQFHGLQSEILQLNASITKLVEQITKGK